MIIVLKFGTVKYVYGVFLCRKDERSVGFDQTKIDERGDFLYVDIFF